MENGDIYKYPGEDVLINLFDCHNAQELYMLEALSTGANLAYLQIHPIAGAFDFKHLKDIHFFIFQDIYDWAGKIRKVDIGKNNLFCRTQYISSYAKDVFKHFYSDCVNVKSDRAKFIEVLAAHYADLNALHPFREGNGRSQREFTRELCLRCGYVLDLTNTSHEEMLIASIESFEKADNSGLVKIFQKCIIPIEDYSEYQKKLTTDLLILSKDDLDDDLYKRIFRKR